MAIDSNSSNDERTGAGHAEKLAASGLKLVTERGLPASGASTIGRAASGPASEGGPGGRSGASSANAETQGRTVPFWLFVAVFALFLLAYGYQTHHASRLELEVSRLEESLAAAQARLESHRSHLNEIRSGLDDLTTRLDGLRALIDEDPSARGSSAASVPGFGESPFDSPADAPVGMPEGMPAGSPAGLPVAPPDAGASAP